MRCRVLDRVAGQKSGTCRSALVSLAGPRASELADTWCGTVQWVGHLAGGSRTGRKNWYVGVAAITKPREVQWSSDEIRIDVYRASGPGGQHVNKTNSAVRVTHLPTGLCAIAQEERSQQRNRSLAMARLAVLFSERQAENEKQSRGEQHARHWHLTRGNPVRVYRGENFERADEGQI